MGRRGTMEKSVEWFKSVREGGGKEWGVKGMEEAGRGGLGGELWKVEREDEKREKGRE